ncbi:MULTISPECIES: hypothetical protein [unclassified Paenibacillus]|uniref:YtpI-like protein n=1 Tax=Paenibacillus provencensis TaxID=441151 RepID=A0ABW3Q3K6_9BACL|nr:MULTISPECIES: hypothetical protein [unclassified Paenibacillus]MCM3130208.1 hypothetical protein [Paenibacillus sp. MER 78]SDX71699.1 hypothetical protein SAMN05518848_11299 [Paenibacillus sp. PDC88]SFS88880.1 hypothetical protein SAMN04488601_10695 [Paenibacillus sp. 453mf]
MNVILWIIVILACLQAFGLIMAKKRSIDTHGFMHFMVRYNMFAGVMAFYLIALLWMLFTISSAIEPNSLNQLLLAASLTLVAFVLPLKIYKIYKEKQKDDEF